MSPLLFVRCMDYLSRIFYYLGELNEFKFFVGCLHLKLNHRCFADDLPIFCKGDPKSAYLTLQGLKLFTESLGLRANSSKLAMYITSILEVEAQRIHHFSGFNREKLHFRYLGVPIFSKKDQNRRL